MQQEIQAVVSIRGLQVAFGKKHALRGVNLDIPHKGVTAVVGPSHAGKSVLLKSLNRMNELEEGVQTSGQVLLDGEDIYAPGTNVTTLRQRLGMVFQKPAAFNMSVYDNVAFAPRLYATVSRAELDDIVEEALAATGLWDEVKGRLKQNAFKLSEGQQQRLCLARVLAASPEMLLMDEPTTGLDSFCTLRVEELARDLGREKPVLFCCDNVQQALRVSDYCAFLLDGEVVEFGETSSLFTFPKDERTQQYILGEMSPRV